MNLINLHIENSYNKWLPSTMRSIMTAAAMEKYQTNDYVALLNRSERSLVIEWWLHNIGYFLTLPFTQNEKVKRINERCKDVALEEWK